VDDIISWKNFQSVVAPGSLLAGIPPVNQEDPREDGEILANLLSFVTSWAQQYTGILGFKEFDTSTPEGRSRERYRRVALTAISSAGTKAVVVLTTFISVPLTLHYLGSERYGMWMTITSIIAMMGIANLGLGMSLINAISETHGQDDCLAAERYASSGFFMLCGIALLIVVGFAVAYPLIPWERVFNVKSPQAIREAGPATAVFIACFAAGLPLGMVYQVQLGYQEGFVNNLWESVGRVLGLGSLLLIIYLKAGLTWLVLGIVGAMPLAALLNSFILYGYRRPWLRPKLLNFHGPSARKLLHTGLSFFFLHTGVILIYGVDNLIITQFLGPEAVTQYAIPYQMFSLSIVIFNIVIAPLWPAYGEAIARGDMAWVRKTLSRSLRIVLLSTGLVSTSLIIFGNQLLYLWVGPKISPSLLLNFGLGIWMMMLNVGGAISILLNASNIFRFQIIFTSLTLIFSIIFKCFFVYYFNLPGIVWGTLLAYLIFFLIPYSLFIRKTFYNSESHLILSQGN
jgi:O-antigen/teichoic acid export membrane protein